MSSYIARFGNYRDSLYSDLNSELYTDDMITNTRNSIRSSLKYSFIKNKGSILDSLYTIDEGRHIESEETTYDNILDCYNFHDTPDINNNKEKRQGIQIENRFPIPPRQLSITSLKRSPTYDTVRSSKRDTIQINSFLRVHFDIVDRTRNMMNYLNTRELKQKYKRKISKNIFCSNYTKETQLQNELIDGTLMIMYRFESWNNYNGLFGGYKSKNNETFLFYMYRDTTNMFIDYLSENLNKHYLKYLGKLQEATAGNIFFKEKFNIKQDITSKEQLFILIEDIKDEFLLRNFID